MYLVTFTSLFAALIMNGTMLILEHGYMMSQTRLFVQQIPAVFFNAALMLSASIKMVQQHVFAKKVLVGIHVKG